MINSIVGASVFAKLWKLFLMLLLFFGSLLWVISIIAVLWAVSDGLIPAIRRKQYKKASAIFLILSITVVIILLSVSKQAIYLFGFILPILLVQLYIRKFIQLPSFHQEHFRNN